MFKLITSIIVVSSLSFGIGVLTYYPNAIWLIHSLSIDSPSWKGEEKIVHLIPKKLALLKVTSTESKCFGDLAGQRISYINLLIDIAMNNYPDAEIFPLDRIKAKELVIHFLNLDCSINEYHPATGFTPLLTALVLAHEDPEYVIEIIKLGGDLQKKFKSKQFSMLYGINGIEYLELVVSKGTSPDLEFYKTLLSQIKANNK
ncbi:hypothetical protein AHAT_42410 [Agarivorans sp. Toyoura001]|uniref:hypothetical protein n=1 Tax=Agarivorans sp. Toyoura001 TaxID=2283141 RepID=UPI0010E454A0|nr:hypothetical protein [Agarivorans sp. Toyoura001]GDY28351.1 hypothetical protein AHAT_42410 [Agarivorans sp. Toyoura001]